jgi:hypothetical protein
MPHRFPRSPNEAVQQSIEADARGYATAGSARRRCVMFELLGVVVAFVAAYVAASTGGAA